MNQNASQIKNLLQDTYNQAQTRIVELAEKAQTTWQDGSSRSKVAIEELVEQLSVAQLLEKIKSHEALQPGSLKNLLKPVGFVTREDINGLKEEIQSLRNDLSDLAGHKELAKLRKEFAALKGGIQTAKTAKTTKTAKKTVRKSTAKKSTAKAQKTTTSK
ncbi:MAG TPA: hypothetical protein EYN66_24535 [Myxococcales bacterium]|nr:hypothetical protein [Myxococcales bacterium]